MVTVGISTVGVGVGVDVGVLVAVGVGVGVSVAVGVNVGVWVEVGVLVTVGVSVGGRLKTGARAVGALLRLFLLTAVRIPRKNMMQAATAMMIPHIALSLLSMLFRYFPWDGLCMAPAFGSGSSPFSQNPYAISMPAHGGKRCAGGLGGGARSAIPPWCPAGQKRVRENENAPGAGRRAKRPRMHRSTFRTSADQTRPDAKRWEKPSSTIALAMSPSLADRGLWII